MNRISFLNRGYAFKGLLAVLYGSTHKAAHFFWSNTEMIGILRQLKSTCTETEKSRNGTQWDMLV